MLLSSMFKLFSYNKKNFKKLLCNEFQFCWISNLLNINLIHRHKALYSPACTVNEFSTCHSYLKDSVENVKNFDPSKVTIKNDGTLKKKKKRVGVKIYLLNEKGISSTMFLQDAEKLAHHQGLKLKKVEDINSIPAYKLVPISDLLENEFPAIKDEELKKEKIKKLIINADINTHDLETKINHINKFLCKGVKVLVKLIDKSSDSSKLNAIYDKLEKSFPGHCINKMPSKSGCFVNIRPDQKAC